MAKTTIEDTKTTETPTPQVTEGDVILPAYFDVAKAAGIVGSAKAQSFFDEVSMAAVGDLSQHYNAGVSFRAMEIAADDENNTDRQLAANTLKRVRQIFAEAQNSK